MGHTLLANLSYMCTFSQVWATPCLPTSRTCAHIPKPSHPQYQTNQPVNLDDAIEPGCYEAIRLST
eukprot:1140927-Pelagomonas_calceolata.AAC.6